MAENSGDHSGGSFADSGGNPFKESGMYIGK